MKKFILFFVLILCSCSEDDDSEINCSLVDVAVPSLYVKIVDSTSANLIEEGSIDLNDIEVEGNFDNAMFLFVPEDEFSNPELHNSLNLLLPFQSQFRYILHLDDLDSVALDFTSELIKGPCAIQYWPVSVSINGEELELEQVGTLQFLAVVKI